MEDSVDDCDDDFDMTVVCESCGGERDYQEWYPRDDGIKCPECGHIQ